MPFAVAPMAGSFISNLIGGIGNVISGTPWGGFTDQPALNRPEPPPPAIEDFNLAQYIPLLLIGVVGYFIFVRK